MKFLKLAFLMILSVSYLTGCSDDDSESVKGSSRVQDSPTNEADETLKSYQNTMANVQLLSEPGVTEASCSEEQIQAVFNNHVLLDQMLENHASEEQLTSSMNEILSRTTTQSCQLVTLTRVAQEASKKYGSVLGNVHPNSPEYVKVGSSMNQLALITSVIGPKINEIRNTMNEANLEYSRKAVAYYDKLRASLNSEILAAQTLIEEAETAVRGCPPSATNCTQEFEYINKLATLNKDILNQIQGPVSNLQSLSEDNPQLKQKLEELQSLVVVVVVGRVLLENALSGTSSNEGETDQTELVPPESH